MQSQKGSTLDDLLWIVLVVGLVLPVMPYLPDWTIPDFILIYIMWRLTSE